MPKVVAIEKPITNRRRREWGKDGDVLSNQRLYPPLLVAI